MNSDLESRFLSGHPGPTPPADVWLWAAAGSGGQAARRGGDVMDDVSNSH